MVYLPVALPMRYHMALVPSGAANVLALTHRTHQQTVRAATRAHGDEPDQELIDGKVAGIAMSNAPENIDNAAERDTQETLPQETSTGIAQAQETQENQQDVQQNQQAQDTQEN